MEQTNNEEAKEQLFCKFCNKTFLNENVFHFHKKGKRHIKAVNSITGDIQEEVDQPSAAPRRTEFTAGQV